MTSTTYSGEIPLIDAEQVEELIRMSGPSFVPIADGFRLEISQRLKRL